MCFGVSACDTCIYVCTTIKTYQSTSHPNTSIMIISISETMNFLFCWINAKQLNRDFSLKCMYVGDLLLQIDLFTHRNSINSAISWKLCEHAEFHWDHFKSSGSVIDELHFFRFSINITMDLCSLYFLPSRPKGQKTLALNWFVNRAFSAQKKIWMRWNAYHPIEIS